MLLKSKDGIICEKCGASYRNKFTYYSLTTLQSKVVNNMRISRGSAGFDADYCENCYNSLIEQAKQFCTGARHKTIKCDLSEKYLSGTFDYFTMNFDKVEVDKELGEEAQVSVERQVMDLNLSQEIYDNLFETAAVIRNKNQSEQWS